MRKLYVVKNERQFENIIKNGKVKKNKYYVIYSVDNSLPYDRFGIWVGKKIGNAVMRNTYKRKLRAIIDNYKKYYINHKDYIIILRREAISKSYESLNKEFNILMNNKKGT